MLKLVRGYDCDVEYSRYGWRLYDDNELLSDYASYYENDDDIADCIAELLAGLNMTFEIIFEKEKD